MDGVINVLKPAGMTSSDVVVRLRKILKTRKIGHTGTLDPEVTGVLPICVGKATRLAEYLTNQGKAYRCEITFGITTDTQDATGEIMSKEPPNIGAEDFQQLVPKFIGTIQQIPPMFSAVKHQGKRLYELARQGLNVERKSREIHISSMKFEEWISGEYPRAIFEVDCSKGTYVRTLCYDMGEALGCGAHMSSLVRLRSGPFQIQESITLETIQEYMTKEEYSFLIPFTQVLDMPRVSLPSHRGLAFRNGLSTYISQVEEAENSDEGKIVQVFSEGEFLGLGIWREQALCPYKVF